MSVLTCELTDEKLLLVEQVRSAQSGDREAFGELVERFERSVYASALRRLGNHVEAQELTQEVFVQALRKIGKWTVEIIKRSDHAKGFEVLPRRWVVERTFAWLGRNRRLAKDFEQSIASATAWLFIASIQLFARRIARQ